MTTPNDSDVGKPVREFWIDRDGDMWPDGKYAELWVSNQPPKEWDGNEWCADFKDPVHVVEFSALTACQAELAEVKALVRQNQTLHNILGEHHDMWKQQWHELNSENARLRSALEKIAEAERMGYGTQRTYGQMAIDALSKLRSEVAEGEEK